MAWREAALECGEKQKLAGGSFIMSLSACWLPLLSLIGVVCGGELTALMGEVFASEGGQVTLSYLYISDFSSGTYFFWYKHLPGRAPHFLMSHSGGTNLTEGPFSVSLEKEQRRLNVLMENADISHSAVYYYAVKTTATTWPSSPFKNSSWTLPKASTRGTHRSADMKRALVCVLMAAWSLGSGGQTVHQPAENVYAMNSGSVALDCSYVNSGGNDYIFWYRQDGQAAPKLILSCLKIRQGETESSFETKFSCSINDTARRAPLKIRDVQLNDSAVFYCAQQPTCVSGYKLVFGSGTRLTVEAQEDLAPSFYKMEGNVTACLATGFSRHNATEKAGKKEVFEGSHAVRISGEPLYNQVALLTAEKADLCEKGDSGPGRCQVAWSPDEKVNLVSLTVLVLRLVFTKTLAINGAMTLHLWFAAP
ncbi:T cell receptor alpha chain MC.7.G5-like [Entelurus aequoreus]|uniref:T cell receptor alpha chain MC.7.G5-like n=1 Tax=Entelurus aequoreus TaxID=161455 RepID=UPI002B1E8930|nr:T cell receptor alpha chain MC.7.G5-like [Entelurus aequoreus]